jgi:hypothetical protein
MGAVIVKPTGGTGYGAGIGVYGEANIQGACTGGTNWSFGVRGTLQLTDDTVLNDGSSIFGAINASMKDDATPTLTAGHVCGIYVENLVDADLCSFEMIFHFFSDFLKSFLRKNLNHVLWHLDIFF